MASQFNLQRSTSLTRCAMRSLASLSRNRTSDAGKIGMISSTDFFNKIGQKLTHAPQQNNAHAGKRLAPRSSHRRIFGLTKVCLPWPNQSPLRCIQTTSFILQTEHNEFATNSVRS